MKKLCVYFLSVFFFFATSLLSAANIIETNINEILGSPKKYIGKTVSLTGTYTGWKNAPSAPPISRSDWVICSNDKKGIYCAGMLPQDPETSEPPKFGDKIGLVAEVMYSEETEMPFLKINKIIPNKKQAEKMHSIMQILFNAPEKVGDAVSIKGVLAKGYGVKGDRQYLLADPTGVIKLGRLPKLYPTGTVLHINGVINEDDNGLPFIDEVQITYAKVE